MKYNIKKLKLLVAQDLRKKLKTYRELIIKKGDALPATIKIRPLIYKAMLASANRARLKKKKKPAKGLRCDGFELVSDNNK